MYSENKYKINRILQATQIQKNKNVVEKLKRVL